MKLTVSRGQLASEFVPIAAFFTSNARIIYKIENRLVAGCTKRCASRNPVSQSQQDPSFPNSSRPQLSSSPRSQLPLAERFKNVVICFLRCAKLCSFPGFCGKLTQTWDRLRGSPIGDLVSRFVTGLRAGSAGVKPVKGAGPFGKSVIQAGIPSFLDRMPASHVFVDFRFERTRDGDHAIGTPGKHPQETRTQRSSARRGPRDSGLHPACPGGSLHPEPLH